MSLFHSVADTLGESIGVLSVGNVELIFKNWFTLSMPRPSSSLIHARSLESKSVARCDTLHRIRDNKLVTHIKIHRLTLTSKSEQIEMIGRNIFIKGSLFIAFDPLHSTKTAKPGIQSTGAKTVCWYAA